MGQLLHDQIILVKRLSFETERGSWAVVTKTKHHLHHLDFPLRQRTVPHKILHILATANMNTESVLCLKQLGIRT